MPDKKYYDNRLKQFRDAENSGDRDRAHRIWDATEAEEAGTTRTERITTMLNGIGQAMERENQAMKNEK